MITFPAVSSFLKREMAQAQRDFAKHPTSLHWQRATRAMLAFQQMDYATRSVSIDRAALLDALNAAPLGDWSDIICRATLGMTAAAALA